MWFGQVTTRELIFRRVEWSALRQLALAGLLLPPPTVSSVCVIDSDYVPSADLRSPSPGAGTTMDRGGTLVPGTEPATQQLARTR